jgi:membrane protease YdiL (CAAX protease family)
MRALLRSQPFCSGGWCEYDAMRPEIMPAQEALSNNDATLLVRHPVATYFALTFTISWVGALLVAAPHLMRGEPLPKMTGILMFPAMLLGPSITGIVLTRIVDGKDGVRNLFSRMFHGRFPTHWYAALLIPPILVLTVLLILKTFVSSSYAPNLFLMGLLFGVPAGYLEEIGWMGYAFPKMRSQNNALAPSILLGLLWSAWHLPVIDYLGTATPHGAYWLPFFLTFTAAMTAIRVLISWTYSNTNSVLLAQLLHMSSTGALVIFSAPRLAAGQEATWYGLYAATLWFVVAVVVKIFGKRLTAKGTFHA